MEEGSLRCDANVSLRPAGSPELGTKTELKNMNSFRFLERGIEAEIVRQAEILDGGGTVEQETLHFDPRTGTLTPLRSKEYSHDYRYFPEPDLVPLEPTEEMIEEARAALPELPGERRERYESELGLGPKQATQLAFDAELGAYFERVLSASEDGDAPTVANWVTGELAAARREVEGSDPTPEQLAGLIGMARGKAALPWRRPPGPPRDGRRRAAIRPRSPSARASARWRTPESSRRSSSARSSPTPMPRSACARATRRRSARWWAS